MKIHTQIYLDYFDINEEDPFIPCEVCDKRAVDIHHIEARGMGGCKKKDDIENLMALCRECHLEYGDIQELIPTLQELHQKRMNK
jgi:hypothetical protein